MKHFSLKSWIVLMILALMQIHTPLQASVVNWEKVDDGILCTLDTGLMKVKICSGNLIQIRYTTLPLFLDKQSLVVTNPWRTIPDFTISDNGEELTVTTDRLQVIINKKSNAIRYTDLNGKLILSEDHSGGKKMIPGTVAGISVYSCETRFDSPADESLYGLGCHPEDSLSVNYK